MNGKDRCKRMKKLIWIVLCALFLAGCGKKEAKEEGEYRVYYVNKEGTGLVSKGYDAAAVETEALIEELVKEMNTNPADASMHPAKPESVADAGYQLEDAFLYMDFGQEYVTMGAVTEVLFRAATVKTLTQIEGIEGIAFHIGGVPLSDQKGNAVGLMTADSFVDHADQSVSGLKRESLNLYFANEAGDALKCEQVEVVYNGSISQEKLILEQLLEGPKAEGYKRTLPADTEILNLSIKDGTCYVNMDSKARELDAVLTEEVAVYSVVNSLTELGTIQKVQFSIDGDTDVVLRESLRLDKPFERNMDLIEQETTE